MESWILITVIMLCLSGFFYTCLIGLFTLGWYNRQSSSESSAVKPLMKVTVIIAARNEENNIADLLDDMAAQHYPPSMMEVLVVDDHSIDKTIEIIRNKIDGQNFHGFKLIKNEVGYGKKAAITAGISMATGDLILLTDADCRVGPRWVSEMSTHFQDESKEMIFGPVAYFPKKGLLYRFQSLEFSGLIGSGAGAALAGYPFICNGANLAYRKSAFIKVNGYTGNEKLISGDDVFLMHKIKKEFGNKSIAFIRDERVTVRTYPVIGLKSFINQRIRWASKSRGYKDILSAGTALVVFSFNFFIIVTFFSSFYYHRLLLILAAAFLLKSLIDLPLMWGVTKFNHQRKLMSWYMPFQVVYPFYVMVAGILSLIPRKKW